MLPIHLKCPCGDELEIMPKHLRDIAEIAKANDWRLIGKSHRGEVGALCPHCASASKAISQNQHHLAARHD